VAVYLIATLDTKGTEAEFLRKRLAELGLTVETVDASCSARSGDRGEAVTAAAAEAARRVKEAFDDGNVDGVIAIGGSAGTTIGTAAMRALPIGVPKLMVSTLASGQVRPWVGDKDILMLNSVVDIAGVNRISRIVLSEAAAAMMGLVRFRSDESNPKSKIQSLKSGRPLIAATMFGVTTPCVQQARKVLEAAGYEVIVFHATGNGGQAMESLIREGMFAGVLDITTTELADGLVGGILSAGPTRLTAAAEMGIPQVVSVGALDMVNFGPRETVPGKFAGRKFHVHNASVTLMRTTAAENEKLGQEICHKLAAAAGPVTILLPLHGVSAIDGEGQPFDDAKAREALYNVIRANKPANVELMKIDSHINDEAFATAAASKLLELIAKSAPAM
jgi:uncharacterized protein (UPF0261 family)